MSNLMQQLVAVDVEALDKMSKELKGHAKIMDRAQILGVVKTYYQLQDFRKITNCQADAVDPDDMKVAAIKEDPALTDEEKKAKLALLEKDEALKLAQKKRRASLFTAFVADQFYSLEKQISKVMDVYSDNSITGRWAKSIVGIGPVISAGLLANIDMSRCPTVGHIWRYAGYDPTIEWLGREKAKEIFEEFQPKGKADEATILRIAAHLNINPEIALANMKDQSRADQMAYLAKPHHNADFKVLCWKIGDCFNKFRNHPDGYYGRLIAIRTAYENEKNERGDYAEYAAKMLKTKRVTNPELKACYESGKLPKGQIFNRAKRYAVKIFLSHWHAVAHREFYGTPAPKPFAIAILGHAHEVPVPNWPVEFE